MPRHLLLPVAALFLALAAPAWTQVGSEPADGFVEVPGDHEFSGRLIVRPRQEGDWVQQGLTLRQARQQADQARDTLRVWPIQEYVWQTDEYLVQLPEPGLENQVSRQLMSTGLFQYAEPDWTVFPIASPNCPDDPQLGSQWHHDASIMDSCEGWSFETGDPTVVVGICDTGIRTTHEDLLQYRQEGYNAVDQLWESQGGSITPVDPHGTQVTGCSSANGDNIVGVAGVGWDLGHRMMRVSNTGGTSTLSILQLAARTSIEAGDRVASVSFSGVDNQSNLTTATYIKSIGGLLVWAAGNDGRTLNLNDRDADDIIVVGATDSADTLASFSAKGPFVDLVAPGDSVYTTDSASDSSYTSVSGTSFSCPLTAGLCALIWSSNPSLTPNDVERILKSGVDDLGAAGVDNTYGYGRIDTLGSMLAMRAIDFDFPGGVPLTVDPVGTTTVQVNVSASISTPVSGTGLLHWFDGTSWNQVAMDEPAPDQYVATIPSVPRSACGSMIQYYFSADAVDGFTYNEPLDAPNSYLSSQMVESSIVLEDLDFEADNGWTVFDTQIQAGTWDRGAPVGGGDRGDPATDFDGSGQCWLTDNRDGNSDVDGGPTSLWSPIYDLTGRSNVYLSYARWFTNDNLDIDRMDVYVSADAGTNWTPLESVADTPDWTVVGFDVTSFASSQFRVRYDVTDNPDDSVTEAGLDRFRIEELHCPLIFDVSPPSVAPGGTLTFTTWKGKARTLAFLFVVEVSGIPIVSRVAFGSFNTAGDWPLALNLPNDPSLSGLAVDLVSFGFDTDGIAQASNVDGFQIR